MKQALVSGLLILLLFGCVKEEKKETPNSIAAGDSKNMTSFSLNFRDSIPQIVCDELKCFDWMGSPLTIDKNEDLDIRVLHSWGTTKGEFYHKAFQIGNNSNEFEFAVEENDTLIEQGSPLTFVRIFNAEEIINENQRWLERDFEHLFFVSLYAKYDATEYSINKNLEDKYIGIRKVKNGKLLYGWIKLAVDNHEVLLLKGSCFAE